MPRPAIRSEGLSWLSIAGPDVKELDVFNTNLGPFTSKHKQKIQKSPRVPGTLPGHVCHHWCGSSDFWKRILVWDAGDTNYHSVPGPSISPETEAIRKIQMKLLWRTLEDLHNRHSKEEENLPRMSVKATWSGPLRACWVWRLKTPWLWHHHCGRHLAHQYVLSSTGITLGVAAGRENGHMTIREIKANLKWETK